MPPQLPSVSAVTALRSLDPHSVAAMRSPLREQVYLACDDEPVTRLDMCQAVNCPPSIVVQLTLLQALDSGLFPSCKLPSFKRAGDPKSKVCDSSASRAMLKWQPQYPSFIG